LDVYRVGGANGPPVAATQTIERSLTFAASPLCGHPSPAFVGEGFRPGLPRTPSIFNLTRQPHGVRRIADELERIDWRRFGVEAGD
jgi:hypothetical protein